jgi:DNA-binding MarR family transcriptional regulator
MSDRSDEHVVIFRKLAIGLVRRHGVDLSARQLAIFLICYHQDAAQTVRGLAAALNISKPSTSRSLDRLGMLGLTRRAIDGADRRSVLVRRTAKGRALMLDLHGMVTRAAEPDETSAAADAEPAANRACA